MIKRCILVLILLSASLGLVAQVNYSSTLTSVTTGPYSFTSFDETIVDAGDVVFTYNQYSFDSLFSSLYFTDTMVTILDNASVSNFSVFNTEATTLTPFIETSLWVRKKCVSNVYGVIYSNYIQIVVPGNSTSISEIKSEVKIYPNPTTDYCVFDFGKKSLRSVEVFDLAGKRVEFFEINEESFVWRPKSKLQGIYLAKVTEGKEEMVLRIIFQ